jgi:hypothetical protein
MTEVAADKPLTPKEEKFAQKILELGDKSAAYRAAYAAGGMQAKSIHVNACKLAKKPNVAARIAELENESAAESKLSRGMIIKSLMAEAGMMDEKDKAKEGSARVRSMELLGKAVDGGIFTDRTASEEQKLNVEDMWSNMLTSIASIAEQMPVSSLGELEAHLAEALQVIEARRGKAPGRGNVVPIQSGSH